MAQHLGNHFKLDADADARLSNLHGHIWNNVAVDGLADRIGWGSGQHTFWCACAKETGAPKKTCATFLLGTLCAFLFCMAGIWVALWVAGWASELAGSCHTSVWSGLAGGAPFV